MIPDTAVKEPGLEDLVLIEPLKGDRWALLCSTVFWSGRV